MNNVPKTNLFLVKAFRLIILFIMMQILIYLISPNMMFDDPHYFIEDVLTDFVIVILSGLLIYFMTIVVRKFKISIILIPILYIIIFIQLNDINSTNHIFFTMLIFFLIVLLGIIECYQIQIFLPVIYLIISAILYSYSNWSDTGNSASGLIESGFIMESKRFLTYSISFIPSSLIAIYKWHKSK